MVYLCILYMQFIVTRLGLTVFLLTGALFLQAQLKITASISPGVIYQNEYATYRVVMENGTGVQKISLPPGFKNFYLVSGPNEEFWESSLNNQPTKKYYAVNYIIQPKISGKLSLGSASVSVNGKSYTTSALQLTVLNNNSSANQTQQNYPFTYAQPAQDNTREPEEFKEFILKKGDDINKKVTANMHLVLEANKQSCYVGEPLVASYNLYTRLKSNSQLQKSPSFNGFSVIDLQQPDDYGFTRKTLQGREYNVYSIRKVQLYPLQPGTFELETAILNNEVQFLKPEAAANPNVVYNLYNGIGVNPKDVITEKISLACKPVIIVVKPLPEKDKPAAFNGAVGQFNMSATVEKGTMSTDESGKLRIAISGSGNMQLITAPEVKWPEGVEAFETKLTDDLNTLTVPVSGTKYFDIPFNIPKEGIYTLPPIQYAYFDPGSSSYKKITTAPIAITVTKGTGTKAGLAHLPVNSKEPLSPLNRLFQNRPLVVTLIAAFIFTGLIFWLRKEQRKEEVKDALQKEQEKIQQRQEEELQRLFIQKVALAQNALKQSEACLTGERTGDFYGTLNREFKKFLSEKLGIHREEISNTKVINAMDKMGVHHETILQAQSLLQDLDRQVYSPIATQENKQEMYDRVQHIVQYLNRINRDTVTR